MELSSLPLRVRSVFTALFFLLPVLGKGQPAEFPNFSLMGNVGAGAVNGFLGNGSPAPSAGLGLGIGIGENLDGLWGLDYYTMPNQEVAVPLHPSSSNPATVLYVLPTDDVSITVNLRWYTDPKYDRIHQRFNTVPYLLLGAGMDMVVDQDPPPPNSNFYSKSFDALFCMRLGVGLDMPLGDAQGWFLYAEGLDHLIAWQGTTQVFIGRIGLKVMLDSEHVDPFRGVF
ncbi:MAG TPA: hypothetical protein VHE12_12430 [bacterium]|nr:hypothetical protein [bacterium]